MSVDTTKQTLLPFFPFLLNTPLLKFVSVPQILKLVELFFIWFCYFYQRFVISFSKLSWKYNNELGYYEKKDFSFYLVVYDCVCFCISNSNNELGVSLRSQLRDFGLILFFPVKIFLIKLIYKHYKLTRMALLLHGHWIFFLQKLIWLWCFSLGSQGFTNVWIVECHFNYLNFFW